MSKVKSGAIQIAHIENFELKQNEIQRAILRTERYKKNYDISVDQMTAISKWLSASLFAVNSGGILTVLNNIKNLDNTILPCAFFVAGLLFCLFSAAINQEFYNRISEPLADMISYWSEVSITGEQIPAEHKKIGEKMVKITKWAWVGSTLGWLSGLLFVVGAIAIAMNIK